MGMEALSAQKPEQIALVVVHGVAPHPRYEFQDQCAAGLRDHLNSREPGGDPWIVEVINPRDVLEPGTDDPKPTISRVRRTGDDPNQPRSATFDVMEAYWSPIDKGHTSAFKVVLWFLKIVFVPLNTTARIRAPWQKLTFDYAFIGGALGIAFAAFALSLSAVWVSFVRIVQVTGILEPSTAGQVIGRLNANVAAPGGVPIKIVVWLFIGIIGAFLIAASVAAIWKTWQQREELTDNPGAIPHRIQAIAILTVLGGLFVYGMAQARFPNGHMGWRGVLFLVVIFVAYQIGRGLIVDFILGFFGDVQIYSTRDENDSTFYHLGEQILDVVVSAIMRAVAPRLNGGHRYDRVIVLSHSLGATIATDALTRIYQLQPQGALTTEEFGRIRAFIMLGSSLEKTKYFFDVAGATPTDSFERWRSRAYEQLFSADPAVLHGKHDDRIFWINYWYFQDPICNEITSYRDVCRNEEGNVHITLRDPIIHSEYLGDPWVWRSKEDHIGILEIITGDLPACKAA
jgi:hypothetical protein